MSDIIHLLPDTVANQIAAGEVIQRPASVIKELVENSIDAGATCINVVVIDAGRTCIQVIDDGKGMSETDARLSFERHATSKISDASDLFNLHTMGFRGEALASIAAVAQVEVKTCLHGSELGTSVTIEGGTVSGQEAVSCAEGTNFMVRNLFFNVPARRKFLKSNSVELSNIVTEFEKIALVNPDVSFTLNNSEVEMYNLPSAPIRQRILNVFGKKLNQQLISLEASTSLVKVSGYVGKPDSSRKKAAHQFFFVNGRYMRHPYFNKAVQNAFEGLVPTGEQVPYFIYFEVDPSNIDVNIHPTKTEIKFENEQAIWQILSAAVREALGKFNAVPTIDFDNVDRPDIPVFSGLSSSPSYEMPQTDFDPSFNPFDSIPSEDFAPEEVGSRGNAGSVGGFTDFSSKGDFSSKVPNDWEDMYDGLKSSVGSSPMDAIPLSYGEQTHFFEQPIPSSQTPSETIDCSAQHYQFKGRFIITTVKSGLMVIDQHRAHLHILYNRYLAQMTDSTGVSQGLLFPEMLQLPASEAVMLDEAMDMFSSVGFSISNLGGGIYSVNGIPAGAEGLNGADLLKSMLDSVVETGANASDKMKSQLALSLASSAAIVAGQYLSNEEMDNIISELFQCDSPTYTKDGKLIFTILKQNDIEKLFA